MHTTSVPLAGSLYVAGPLIAFAVVAALVAVLRWTFDGGAARKHPDVVGTDPPPDPQLPPGDAPGDPTPGGLALGDLAIGDKPLADTLSDTPAGAVPLADDQDYGLLSVAGTVESMAEAQTLQDLLAIADIRSTTAPMADGAVRVLVFTSDLARARRVAGS